MQTWEKRAEAAEAAASSREGPEEGHAVASQGRRSSQCRGSRVPGQQEQEGAMGVAPQRAPRLDVPGHLHPTMAPATSISHLLRMDTMIRGSAAQ